MHEKYPSAAIQLAVAGLDKHNGQVEDGVSGIQVRIRFTTSLEMVLAFSVRDLIPSIPSHSKSFCTSSLLSSIFDYSVLVAVDLYVQSLVCSCKRTRGHQIKMADSKQTGRHLFTQSRTELWGSLPQYVGAAQVLHKFRKV